METDEYAKMHAMESEYWWFVGRRAIIACLLAAVPFPAKRHRRLLDIGCGTGANLPMLRLSVGPQGQVVAMDQSPHALQFTHAHPAAPGIELVQGDALNLPFPDNTFHVLTLFDVLEHLGDDRRALAEVRRVLRPDGALVFTVPAYKSLWSTHDEALHHFRRYEYDELRSLLRESGFGVERLSHAMGIMPPLVWLWHKIIPLIPEKAMRRREGTVLPRFSSVANQVLIEYLKLETRLLTHHDLPLGTSLVGIAVKPAPDHSSVREWVAL